MGWRFQALSTLCDGMIGQTLQRAAQRRMVQLRLAMGGAALHQLGGAGGVRQADTHLTRALQRQVQVFLVQADAKTRVKGASDHALAVHFQNAAGGKTAHQRLAHPGRIGPRLAGEQQQR